MKNNKIKKQLPINFSMNVIAFILKVLIGLWIIPYLVKHIGIIAYGLVPLSLFFAEYVSVIIASFNSAMNRYLLVSLQKKNYRKANEIFNTSLILAIIFILFQSIIMSIIITNLASIINIPKSLESDAYWLFTLTFIGFSFSLLRGVFITPLFSNNRLDLIKIIEIIYITANAIIIIFLFSLYKPSLAFVGIAFIISSFLALIVAIYFKKKIVPELKIDIPKFNMEQVKELASMGGWVLVTQVGSLLFLKFDLFLANKFIGASEAGAYSLVLQWNSLIRAMASIISGIMTPVIMIYYANKEIGKLIKFLKIGIKTISLTIAIPIAIISGFSNHIIIAWIGNEYLSIQNILIISISALIINISTTPLLVVAIAYNKVKIPGIASLIFGVLSIIVTILFLKYTNYNLYAIVIISAFFLTLKNGLFIPFYVSNILNINKNTFVFYPLTGLSFFILIFILSKFTSSFIAYNSILSLFYMISLIFMISLLILFLYSKNDKDMKYILNMIQKKFKKEKK